MKFLKTCKKFIFPGHFKTLIENIKDAFDEINNNEKQHMYLKLKKEFEKIKKDKNNSCNNNNNTKKNSSKSDDKKKIAIVTLLFAVLENDIDFDKLAKKVIYASDAEQATIISKIRKIKEELESAEEKLDEANTTINSVHTSKNFLTKKVEELLNKVGIQLEALAYVNSNVNTTSKQLEKRLKTLRIPNGGSRTRNNRNK